jgi:monoterpene epsilon-lactone hydrolase
MDEQPYVHIPETVSPEAQDFLRTLKDPHLTTRFPDPTDIAAWKKVQAWAEADGKAKSEPLVKRYQPFVQQGELGGVPVLEVRPKDWKDNGKAIVYTHGGAYVMYSAASMLGRSAVAAHESGLRVISIDYTLAPQARYNQITDQAVAAIQALLKQGQRLEDTAIYGDSAGGGLAAATVLKMRDRGLGMPAVAVLVSPWLDTPRAAIRKLRCTTPTRTSSMRNTASTPRRRSPIPKTRRTRTPRPSMATSPRVSRRRLFREASRRHC